MAEYEKRLENLDIKWSVKNRKGKGIVSLKQDGNLLYLSGHGCEKDNGELIYRGKVGAEVTVEQSYEAPP